jgi:hypothetical protein
METLKATTAKTVSFNRHILPYIRALYMIKIRRELVWQNWTSA